MTTAPTTTTTPAWRPVLQRGAQVLCIPTRVGDTPEALTPVLVVDLEREQVYGPATFSSYIKLGYWEPFAGDTALIHRMLREDL